jgi:hypothetical protein
MGEAAARNPHVVDRLRSPAPDGWRGQPSPGGGYCLVANVRRTRRVTLDTLIKARQTASLFAADVGSTLLTMLRTVTG